MASQFHSHRRATCRICGGKDLHAYLDLGQQPPSNSFIAADEAADEKSFPLAVALCRACGLSQLLDVVLAEDIFDDYLYLSSTSKALCQHYEGLVADALRRFGPGDDSLMVDIGCNDGVLLKGYPPGRFRLLGVEPSSVGEYAKEAGFEVLAAFFNEDTGRQILESHGGADIVTATNVFAHVDDIRSFAKGIKALLAYDGVYIIEFPYLLEMVENIYFDTIYHEHLSYLALTPLARLFANTGLRAFRVERVDLGASGPALRLFICLDGARHAVEDSITQMLADERAWDIDDPARYQAFASRVAGVKETLREWVARLNREGHKVGAYCAPAKGNTLLNYVGLGPEDIVAVSDNNDLKVGKVTPGSHIPIVGDQEFLDTGITHALLLAWNYLDFFLENAEFIRRGGKFIVPLPKPRIAP
jgi:hypothetical protein